MELARQRRDSLHTLAHSQRYPDHRRSGPPRDGRRSCLHLDITSPAHLPYFCPPLAAPLRPDPTWQGRSAGAPLLSAPHRPFLCPGAVTRAGAAGSLSSFAGKKRCPVPQRGPGSSAVKAARNVTGLTKSAVLSPGRG